MKKILQFIAMLATFALLHAEDDLVRSKEWRTGESPGAKISFKKLDDGTFELTRSSMEGNTVFLPKEWIQVAPETDYRLSVTLRTVTPGTTAAAMLESNDKTRRPFPRSKTVDTQGKSETIHVELKTRPSETKLNILLAVEKPGTVVVEKVTLQEIIPDANLLNNKAINWGNRVRGGATGSVTRTDDAITASRTNSDGEIMVLNENYLPLVPGKYYRVMVKLQADADNSEVRLMLQMPGSARRPFPLKKQLLKNGKSEEVVLFFQANEDEKSIRIHLLPMSKGNYRIDSIQLEEVDKAAFEAAASGANFSKFECAGADLGKYVMPIFDLESRFADGIWEALVQPYNGGFKTAGLNWQADKIKTIEVDFKAANEGGFLRLDFDTEYDGKKYTSYQTFAMPPDHNFRTVRFPVSEDIVWKGTVKNLTLSWQNIYKPCRIFLAGIRALPEDNLIAAANHFASQKVQKLDLLVPRGEYLLEWRGATHPDLELDLQDSDYKTIQTVKLPAKEQKIRFKANPATVTAILKSADGAITGSPRLTLENLPQLDRKEAAWRGSWIWSRNGQGPNDATVWFAREFTLSAPPEEAFLLGSGDDKLEVIINGEEFFVNSHWDEPGRIDVTRYLKKGVNQILLKTYNAGAWGGVLMDLYIKDQSGHVQYIVTDDNWRCSESPRPDFAAIDQPVHVIGAIPVAPWGSRVGYHYVGPRAQIEVKNADKNQFTAKIINPAPLNFDKLDFRIELPDGTSRLVEGRVTPHGEKWAKGDEIAVKFDLQTQNSATPGTAKVFLDTPFIDCTGLPQVGSTEIRPNQPQVLSEMKIIGAGERSWFVINGQKSPPIYFDLPSNFIKSPFQRDFLVRNAVKGGNSVIRMAHNIYDLWTARDTYNFDALDQAMAVIDLNAPDQHVILVSSTYMPSWWLKENPDDVTKFFGNVPLSYNDDFQTIASTKWLKDLTTFYSKLVDHIRRSPYAAKVVGIAPCDGSTWEWMWSHGRGHKGRVYSGWSNADLASYRAYLTEKYPSDDALAKAWNQPHAQIASALPPSPDRIDQSSVGEMLDPLRDMDIIDWSIYRNETLSDAFISICKIIKDNTDSKWVAGSYYGYLNMFSWMQYYLQDGGHLRISKVARSPYVDFVYGPSNYHWRKPGMGDGYMQPAEAFSSHGKPVIVEQDVRNYTEPTHYEVRNGKTSTVEQSLGSMDRAFAMLLTRGMGLHWMEMYERWFREPVILDLMKKQNDFYRTLPEKPLGSTPREFCIVSDEDSAFYVKTNMGGIHVSLIAELMRLQPETATAFRHVLKKDLLEPNVIPPQKLYVITNLFTLSKAERTMLLRRFEAEKATVLWLYAPGVFFPDHGPKAENMTDLLGLTFTTDLTTQPLQIHFVDNRFGIDKAKCESYNAPWFFPASGFDEVLAKDPAGRPALVKWSKNGVTNYFSSLPNPPPALLRSIAREAKIQVYADSGDPVLVGNDIVALHAKTSGVKQLQIPADLEAKSVFGPQVTLQDNRFEAVAGRTYGFLLTPKQK